MTERRSQADRKRDAENALLAAAAALFAENGIDNTSLAAIGAAAGYSRGLVNHHFGSKSALVERLARLGQRTVRAALPERDPAEALDALRDIVHTYLAAVTSQAPESRAFIVMWGAAVPAASPLRPIFAREDENFRAAVASIVRAGRDVGAVDIGADPIGFATAFVAMMRGTLTQYLVDPERVDLAAAREAALRFITSIANPTAPNTRSTRRPR